jgi:hypothetical protein
VIAHLSAFHQGRSPAPSAYAPSNLAAAAAPAASAPTASSAGTGSASLGGGQPSDSQPSAQPAIKMKGGDHYDAEYLAFKRKVKEHTRATGAAARELRDMMKGVMDGAAVTQFLQRTFSKENRPDMPPSPRAGAPRSAAQVRRRYCMPILNTTPVSASARRPEQI